MRQSPSQNPQATRKKIQNPEITKIVKEDLKQEISGLKEELETSKKQQKIQEIRDFNKKRKNLYKFDGIMKNSSNFLYQNFIKKNDSIPYIYAGNDIQTLQILDVYSNQKSQIPKTLIFDNQNERDSVEVYLELLGKTLEQIQNELKQIISKHQDISLSNISTLLSEKNPTPEQKRKIIEIYYQYFNLGQLDKYISLLEPEDQQKAKDFLEKPQKNNENIQLFREFLMKKANIFATFKGDKDIRTGNVFDKDEVFEFDKRYETRITRLRDALPQNKYLEEIFNTETKIDNIKVYNYFFKKTKSISNAHPLGFQGAQLFVENLENSNKGFKKDTPNNKEKAINGTIANENAHVFLMNLGLPNDEKLSTLNLNELRKKYNFYLPINNNHTQELFSDVSSIRCGSEYEYKRLIIVTIIENMYQMRRQNKMKSLGHSPGYALGAHININLFQNVLGEKFNNYINNDQNQKIYDTSKNAYDYMQTLNENGTIDQIYSDLKNTFIEYEGEKINGLEYMTKEYKKIELYLSRKIRDWKLGKVQ